MGQAKGQFHAGETKDIFTSPAPINDIVEGVSPTLP